LSVRVRDLGKMASPSSFVARNGSLRYKDKVCIITGGSQGIGEGCVRVFGK